MDYETLAVRHRLKALAFRVRPAHDDRHMEPYAIDVVIRDGLVRDQWTVPYHPIEDVPLEGQIDMICLSIKRSLYSCEAGTREFTEEQVEAIEEMYRWCSSFIVTSSGPFTVRRPWHCPFGPAQPDAAA